MSGYDWDDDEQDTPKGMRKQLEEMSRKLSERDTQIAELMKGMRQRNVADALKDLGVTNSDKVSRLIPENVAEKPDALKAWLDEYKDIFVPASPPSPPEAPTNKDDESGGAGGQSVPNLPAEQMAAFQRLQTADAAAGTSSPDLDSQHLAALATAREKSNGSFDRYIAILRGEEV